MVPTIQCLLKSFLTQDVFLDKYIFKQSVKVKHDFQTFGIDINVITFNFYAEYINHRRATSLKPVLSTGCLTPTHWCGIKTTSNIGGKLSRKHFQSIILNLVLVENLSLSCLSCDTTGPVSWLKQTLQISQTCEMV